MDLLTWPVLVLAVPAVIFAGVSKAGFGSGISFASASILALVLPPAQALAIMLPLLLLIDCGSLPAYWRKWSAREVRVLLMGGVPGAALGILFLARADADAIRLLIGVICLLFVAWQGAAQLRLIRLPETRAPAWQGGLAGAVMGFTTFVSHAGGPVAAIYMLRQRLDKTSYQATTVFVFWALNLFKLVAYGGLGLFDRDTLMFCAALAPAAALGTWIGIRAHHLVSERAFFGFTYVALGLTGLKLIHDALAGA